MSKIRVLVVDDSVVIRRLVSDSLKQDAALEVVGVAANGKIALQMVPQHNPDVMVLDVEMPEMDGLQTLREMRKLYPRVRVIMFSTLTERGAGVTLDALSLGASDYVTKPANVGSVSDGMRRIQEELIPKIRSLAGQGILLPPPGTKPAPAKPAASGAHPIVAPLAKGIQRKPAILAIGTSTGGPNALAELMPALPADYPVPIVIVQHMPPLFTRILADRLNAKSHVRVCEAEAEMVLEKGHAYIAPGDFHMVLHRAGDRVTLALNKEQQENSCRPSVDVLFRSVVQIYGAATLGLILTGMGQDGLRGCELVHEAGGQIVVQDEATSVVWGMPGFVARAGLAQRVLPLSLIGREIVDRTIARELVPSGRRD